MSLDFSSKFSNAIKNYVNKWNAIVSNVLKSFTREIDLLTTIRSNSKNSKSK